jgi:fused signal recognition particle receptor
LKGAIVISPAHADQLVYLVIFIAALLLALLVPITLSVLRKSKSPSPPEGIKTAEKALAVPVATEGGLIPLPVEGNVVDPESAEASLAQALIKTEENFFGRIRRAFSSTDKKRVLEDIEEVLYTSDLGPKTVERLLEKVQHELASSELAQLDRVKQALASEMELILEPVHKGQSPTQSVKDLIRRAVDGPTVLMIVGVNGAGKTTSIGKIAAQLASQNFKVLVAAGDTFRAAAGGQLKAWTERAQQHQQALNSASAGEGLVDIFWPENTNDPAAVAFDAVARGKAKGFDFVIVDTAGRLHTQAHLMDELKKVQRVMTKVIAEAPHETWIVLDANSGQNALLQATEFNKALQLTGVVLTKMDGTAKGGVALGVVQQLNKPIRLVGIGEKIRDLKVFDQKEYIASILGRSNVPLSKS